ncbi:MAG: hypothetical protein ACRDHN_10530 [Thermomicrobiales bacterium]
MSDDPLIPEVLDGDIDTSPVSPRDVASAARSCQVIILIVLALTAISCVVVAVTFLR